MFGGLVYLEVGNVGIEFIIIIIISIIFYLHRLYLDRHMDQVHDPYTNLRRRHYYIHFYYLKLQKIENPHNNGLTTQGLFWHVEEIRW